MKVGKWFLTSKKGKKMKMKMKMNWTKEMFLEVFGKEGQQMIDETYEQFEGTLSKDEVVKAIIDGFNKVSIKECA